MTEEQKERKRRLDREYYQKNKERRKEYMAQYHTENKDKNRPKRREYLKQRRTLLKEEAKQKLGGKCVICGTKENLEFDHIDPATKKYTVSNVSCSLEEWWNEVEKCRLLCKEHHKVLSDAEMAAKQEYWLSVSYEERQKLIQKHLDA